MLPSRSALALAALGTLAAPAHAGTAFRFTDLDLRDPHLFYPIVSICFDVTDNPSGSSFNDGLQNAISTLSLNYLLVFDPLDPLSPGGSVQFGLSGCTGPTVTCTGGTLVSLPYTNSSSGTCLGVVAGTTRPYSPAIATPIAPCFVTAESALLLNLGLFQSPLPMQHAQIGATYSGAPTSLATGLIRGFVTETDANALIYGASSGSLAGRTLSSTLPGGVGCCSGHSDKDIVDGQTGWWFYWNFTANQVPFTPVGVEDPPAGWIALTAAYPNPFDQSVSVRYQTIGDGTADVAVYDTQGRRIADLARGPHAPGMHTATWNGRTASGTPATPGIYLVRLAARGRVEVRRIIRLQ